MYFGLTASLNHSKFDPTSPAIFIPYHPNVGEHERDPARRGRGGRGGGRGGRGGGRGGRAGGRGGRDSGSDISDSDSDGRVHATESYRD